MDMAAARPEPIPFYAEMSSTNPVFILPGALRERGESIAAGLHASFTLGAGQFCTKPGMVFVPQGSDAATFARTLQQLVGASAPFHLLTRTIRASYDSAIAGRRNDESARLVGEGPKAAADAGFAVSAALFETDAVSFLSSDLRSALKGEIFGPTTLLVRHSGRDQVLAIASAGNYVEFVLRDGRKLLMRSPLSALENELSPRGFLRTHRSWLVNAGQVTALKPEGSGDYTVELGSLAAPLSRRFPAALARLRGG